MARQGWLEPVRLPEGAGYRLTPRAVRRLREAADRIYRRHVPAWDGRWHVVVVERVSERATRDRIRSGLGYLGYACLDGSTWISPRASIELDGLLAAEQVGVDSFYASYDGDARLLAAKAWDIERLATGYQEWLEGARAIVGARRGAGDEEVFAMRSELVHEWRKFLFVDPGLPAELLPARWPGKDAALLFHAEAERLLARRRALRGLLSDRRTWPLVRLARPRVQGSVVAIFGRIAGGHVGNTWRRTAAATKPGGDQFLVSADDPLRCLD